MNRIGIVLAALLVSPLAFASNDNIVKQTGGWLNAGPTGTFAKMDDSGNIQATGFDALTGGVLNFPGTNATSFTFANANATGNGFSVTENSLTTGTGLLVTSSGTLTAGQILSLVGNSATTGGVLTASGTGLTGGILAKLAGPSSGSTFTGNLLALTSASTGNLGTATASGAFNLNLSGAHTGAGFQVDDVTATGTVAAINATALTTGSGLNIASSGVAQTSSSALNVVQSGTTTGYTGNFISFTGSSTTGAGNLLSLTAVNTTAGSAESITANSATTSTAGILAVSGTALTSGNALVVKGGSEAAVTAAGRYLSLQDSAGNENFGVGADTHLTFVQATVPGVTGGGGAAGTCIGCTDTAGSAAFTPAAGVVVETVSLHVTTATPKMCVISPGNVDTATDLKGAGGGIVALAAGSFSVSAPTANWQATAHIIRYFCTF